MSSLYTRSKEFTRNRKSQSDSPPASPSPTAKTLRVSSFYLRMFLVGSEMENVYVTWGVRFRAKAFQNIWESVEEKKIASKDPVSFSARGCGS